MGRRNIVVWASDGSSESADGASESSYGASDGHLNRRMGLIFFIGSIVPTLAMYCVDTIAIYR